MRARLHLAMTAIALGLLAATSPARAQGFHGVFTKDGQDVWAVGDGGVYYRSLDSGLNWGSGALGTLALRDVAARGLTVVVVGDGGKVWRSANNGGSWIQTTVAGTPDLRGAVLPSDGVGYAVGAAGTILKSTDGGANWFVQNSGTVERLNAVEFTDALSGWVVGDNGVALRTIDGGSNWNPVATGNPNHLYAVDQVGSLVWIGGGDGSVRRSLNGGGAWSPVNLKMETGPDVRAIWLQSVDSIYVAGGGGFIRRSVDGGQTWDFPVHNQHGQISSLAMAGGVCVAASNRNLVVISSLDRGVTWRMPTGATLSRSWQSKLTFAGSVRGASFGINNVYRNTLYCALGNLVYRSRDEGETWQSFATIPNSSIVNAFIVSPKDSNVFLAAVSGVIPKRIVKSDDHGQSWITTLTHDFGVYGIPMEYDHDRPDTIFFGGDGDGLYRSTDVGKNWERISSNNFRSPCDIIVVPDSGNIILVGDGITGNGQGQYFKSTDGGFTFALKQTRPVGASEVPGMACSRLRNSVTFGTNWAGGGVQRTSDYGETWPNVSGVGSAWGVDIARDDPNVMVFGVYSGGQAWFSIDGGNIFNNHTLPGSNYSFFLRDRGLILAEQAGGIYKMLFAYAYSPSNAQTLSLVAPNGGEVWNAGSVHEVQWTSTNLALARIEYRGDPGDPWQLVAEVPGYLGRYVWTVPAAATNQATVRVRDAWDTAPEDVSSASFTITAPLVAGNPVSLDFGIQEIGTTLQLPLEIENQGNINLVVGSITAASGAYTADPLSLIVPPGQSTSITVGFSSPLPGSFPDTLLIASNAANQPVVRIPLAGVAIDTLSLEVAAPDGGESWQYGSVHDVTWSSTNVASVAIEYQTVPAGPWKPIAASVPASLGTYAWSIPYDTTAHARLRVREASGPRYDLSDAEFALTAPLFDAPAPLRMFLVLVGNTRRDPIRIENTGNAPLVVSSVTIDDPKFWPGRTSFVIPARSADTLGIFFKPVAEGRDSATLTIVADDPFGPHVIGVTGEATTNVSVLDRSPAAIALWQNRPNPFAGLTQIRYALPAETEVSLEVYNLQGQRVATLVRGTQGPGTYAVGFGPGAATATGERLDGLAAGVYFYRFQAGAFASTRKMLMLR